MPDRRPLTVVQHQVLTTLRFAPRLDRWDHVTLCTLRDLGLVTSARAEGSKTNYRWTITDLGKHVYSLGRGAAVPEALPQDLG